MIGRERERERDRERERERKRETAISFCRECHSAMRKGRIRKENVIKRSRKEI